MQSYRIEYNMYCNTKSFAMSNYDTKDVDFNILDGSEER